MPTRKPISTPGPPTPVSKRYSIPPKDLFLYARSFHVAAKTLASSFQADANPFAEADASAVVYIYRHAIELSMKSIVLGDGGNFLATKPDRMSVSKSHSLSWLAQFVSQVINVVKWETEFKCEGVETLADFKAFIDEINSVDPGSYSFRCPFDPKDQFGFREFARRMDAVIGLLESTGDALAAEWDLRSDGVNLGADWNGGGFGPTIQ